MYWAHDHDTEVRPKLTDLLKCFEIVLHSKASLTHTPHTDREERYMVSILSGMASVFAAGTLY